MLIAEFVYKIYDQGFVLWLDGKKVKYRQYKPTDKFDEIIRLIGVYKKEIIKFLEFNNCYDAPIFIPDHIYKLNELKMQLSFAQERVWFIERYEGGTHAYNIPLVFKLKDLV
ncbi:MAG: hypothetical protein EBY20_08130, partial [Alphaproteobacteria bacterium]|nr:hypothetical protein [Alphaproteobacteria bacterium]